MAGGMTSIYIGVTGLQSAQTALNTTTHNLANVYTDGYTRQLSFTGDRIYNTIGQGATSAKQIGLGVSTTVTSRMRAILLDKSFRTESGRQGFYDSRYQVATEIETYMGETEGVQFQKSLETMWSAISEMAKTPDSIVSRSELVMYAETFMERAKSIYQELTDYQKNIDTKVRNMVDKINSIGDKIHKLNLKISGIETSVENANDLRDKRDLLLDELSRYIKIDYEENENNYVTIKAEGVPFVTEGGVFHMGTAELDSDKDSNLCSVVWPYLNKQETFYLEEPISTANKNDIGELKGLLLARGDFAGKYTDVPDAANFDMTTAEGRAAYTDAVNEYNKTVDCCTVVKAEAIFDKLINTVVTSINDVLSPLTSKVPDGVTTYTDSDGNTYNASEVKILDTNTSTGDDGKMPPEELFSRDYTSRYIEVTGDDGKTYYMYNEKNTDGHESLYTISNMSVNQAILEDYSKLPFRTLEGDNDLAKGAELVEIWNKTDMTFDPNSAAKLNFKTFYQELIYDIGNAGEMFNSVATNEATAVSQIDDSRTVITGVSSEDELTNMIKFQSAYNASSRYVSTIADMLEYIIERLGA